VKYKGKVAIITGSSRGIGKAIAIQMAQQGCTVVLNGRNQERLDQALAEVKQYQDQAISIRCDVGDSEEAHRLVEETVSRFGRLDILINNVGVSNRGKFADTHPDVFRKVFDTNLFGSVNPTVPAMPHIRESKGSIVFISSLAGIRGLPELSAYCSAKMGLRAVAESIRIEEVKSNIHVGLIYVGRTEIEPNKEAIAADGSLVILKERHAEKLPSTGDVARSVLKNIDRRKFITTLTTIGKIQAFLQPRFPWLIERIVIRASKRFTAANE
jgi:NAD(P)-dependent dehydrogenase (short-subunit alcohol dehydrogenase family)